MRVSPNPAKRGAARRPGAVLPAKREIRVGRIVGALHHAADHPEDEHHADHPSQEGDGLGLFEGRERRRHAVLPRGWRPRTPAQPARWRSLGCRRSFLTPSCYHPRTAPRFQRRHRPGDSSPRRPGTAGAHIVGECAQRGDAVGLQRGVPAHELRDDAVFEAEHVVEHEHLAIAMRSGADADRGDRQRVGDHARHLVGHAFEHDREATGVLERLGVVDQRERGGHLTALHLEAAHRVHRLRGEPDVTHHRDLGVHDRLDHRQPLAATLELHGLRAGLRPGGRRCAPSPRPTRGSSSTAGRR